MFTIALCAASFAQARPDPLMGNWELNAARTHYGGGAERRLKETFRCETKAATIVCTIRSSMADGRTITGRFEAAYNGPAGSATGIPDVDAVRLVRVSDAVADAVFSYRGRPVFAYRAVRSDDRRSLTIIAVDPVNRAVLNSVVVYDLLQ